MHSIRLWNSVLRPSRSVVGGRSAMVSVTSRQTRSFSMALENSKSGAVLKNLENKSEEAILPKIWLRDNCRCTSCVNQDTMQRNFNTFEIPENIDLKTIEMTDDAAHVTWSDLHSSSYTWKWLESTLPKATKTTISEKDNKKLWGSEITANPPEVVYNDVMSAGSDGMAKLTNNLRLYGLCFVTGTPPTPEASEKLLSTIGPIRNTHYGGFYDFIPDLALADTAYTNLALSAHTDTTYFSEPAGLQSFHLLSHTAPSTSANNEALGGQSLLVDGFHAAAVLKAESPEDYDCLRTVRLPWHASGNEGVAISPDETYPVIEGDSPLRRIRWNNDDRGVVPMTSDASVWYRAARKWHEILTRKETEYWFQLQPGRLLIFDNWRVLHGRSAFEGTRRICGGYISRDDFVSQWKLSNYPRDEVIASNIQRQ
ncbi:hypothetical protein VHEMI00986 [[Torrubiella] hemipterigena]|uniref:Trimethyllysine dioxygenase n=1 Tax=[Torrubiella] hemipterigena TaxID=1531966 RepID=A0A0A1SRW3_9HYPO|nr:hypothetical protein VHEMI00986 [[Torrubiella] hemipterigena]